MKFGAGVVAARSTAPPRSSTRDRGRSARSTRRSAKYDVGPVLPAMGYSEGQLAEMEKIIDAADVDLVVIGTPIDLRARDRHPQAGGAGALRPRGPAGLADAAGRARAGPRSGPPERAPMERVVVALGGQRAAAPRRRGHLRGDVPGSRAGRRADRRHRRRRLGGRRHPRQRAAGRAGSCCSRRPRAASCIRCRSTCAAPRARGRSATCSR